MKLTGRALFVLAAWTVVGLVLAVRGSSFEPTSASTLSAAPSQAASVAAPPARSLEQRLQALEDERQIIETLHRYTHTIDYGPPEAWANVFTPDGVFDVYNINGKPAHKENGRGELARYLSTKRLPPILYDKHVVLSPVIQSNDGKTAKVDSYIVMFREMEDGGPRVSTWGRYYDILVKQPDGRWLIKERKAEMEVGAGRAFKKEWANR
jgi:hypothetical protein